MTAPSHADDDAAAGAAALDEARQWLEPGAKPPPPVGERALALAWALKNLCYEAWHTEPVRAVRAAQALAGLLASGVPTAAQAEVRGLAQWTEGIACLARGEMADAVEALDRAAESLRAAGRADAAAQTRVPCVMALSMLGRLDDAAHCGEDALREFLELGDFAAAGKTSLNLGSLQMRRDDYAAAARHYREAAVWLARAGDHRNSVLADGGLADAVTAQGDFDEALRIYARGRMRAARHRLAVVEATFDESVALLELARGRYREALAGLESSRARYEQLAMPQHLAIAEKQLGDAYLELRLLPEAVGLYRQALSKFEALDMPFERAWTLAQRGRAEAAAGRVDESAASLAEAAKGFAEQGNEVGGAAVSLARAELALATGDAEAAERLASRSSEVFEAAGQAEARLRADVVRGFARLRTGDRDGAQSLLQSTLSGARDLQVLPVQVRSLAGLGLVASARGDGAGARAAHEASIELFEEQRHALPGDDLRSAFLADHLLPYREMLRMRLAEHAAGQASGESVLAELERVRARTLGERLARPMPVEPDEATQALRARLNWLYRRARRLEDDAPLTPALQDELRATERELLERARRRRLSASAARDEAAGGSAFDCRALQRLLADGDALVEYAVLDDELLACVVTARGVEVVRALASWAEVVQALRAMRFQIDTLRHGAAPVQRHLSVLAERARQRLRRLHALVWAPLLEALEGARRVAVVPHGPLGALPFAALEDERGVLADGHVLSVAASARHLAHGLARAPVAARRVLAIGESSRLPHAEREAQVVASRFPEGDARVGEQATIAALRLHAADAQVLHLACHAEFRADNPLFSALHLADGALTAEQAEQLALPPGVVVLSACETGLADDAGGDEMFGLVRAFLVGGAARVVASLWPVDDQVTAGLMTAFYDALQGGASPAEALRTAQGRTREVHPHPSHWAAFTLHGGW